MQLSEDAIAVAAASLAAAHVTMVAPGKIGPASYEAAKEALLTLFEDYRNELRRGAIEHPDAPPA